MLTIMSQQCSCLSGAAPAGRPAPCMSRQRALPCICPAPLLQRPVAPFGCRHTAQSSRARQARRAGTLVCAEQRPSLQLATAKLPRCGRTLQPRHSGVGELVCETGSRHPVVQWCARSQCDTAAFSSSIYQWAATITHSGQNMPFALPFRTDPLPNGFQVRSPGDAR